MIQIIEYISMAIACISIGVIAYGIIVTAISFIRNEIKKDKPEGIRKLRADFGGYLLLGLELLIGADIIKTIVEPSYEELIILGGIVVLRTVLSVFLNKEVKELDE